MPQTVHNGSPKMLTEMAENLPTNLPDILKEGQEKLSDLSERAVDFIRRRPAAALVGALCLGFVFARLVSRR